MSKNQTKHRTTGGGRGSLHLSRDISCVLAMILHSSQSEVVGGVIADFILFFLFIFFCNHSDSGEKSVLCAISLSTLLCQGWWVQGLVAEQRETEVESVEGRKFSDIDPPLSSL